MDKKLFKNYIYNILYQLARLIPTLVTVPYLYSHVGADTLGISDFAGNIAGWFILFGVLGVNTYGNRTIAKVRDNKDDLSRTFWEILLMQFFNMVIATVFYFLYVHFTVGENKLIYYLTGLTLLASILDITWFFYGVEDFKVASIRNICVKIIGVILIMLIVKTPEDLYKYVIINGMSEVIGQGAMFIQLRKYISFSKVSVKEAYQNHFRSTFALFIPTIAISIYTLLDQTMIGFLYNEEHVNYYKTAMSFIKIFLYFITSIGAVMLPRVTNVFYNQDNAVAKVENMVNTTMKIAMLLSIPMCLGLMAITPNFVTWYLPTAPVVGELIILGAPIVIFISMSNVTGTQYMVPTGMHKMYSRSVIYAAIINFSINFVLIPKYGAFGAIVGTLVSELCVTVIQYVSVKKTLSITIFNKSSLSYIVGGILMYIVVVFIGNIMSANVISNVIQVICGVFVYFLVLVITKEDIVYRVIKRVMKRD